jgi:hypothetical protein
MPDNNKDTFEGPEIRAEIAARLRRRRTEWSAAERAELWRGPLIALAGCVAIITMVAAILPSH